MAQQTLAQQITALQPDLQALGVNISAAQTELLVSFCMELLKWNRSFNLVSRRDVNRLAGRHVFDSLTGAALLENDAREQVLDVGSGAGFPGIPLAVALPRSRFVLVDRSARRVRFLRHIQRLCGLDNLQVEQCNLVAQSAQMPGLGPFSAAVARAVASPAELWRLVQPLLQARGRMLVYESTRAGEDVQDPALPAGLSSTRHAFGLVATGQNHAILQVQQVAAGAAT